ncbi:hypothetical protein RJ639_007942, partial [Escallonia herrerae]
SQFVQMKGRSYSPPPRGGYGRRSPSPRGRYGGRGRDLPTSLLVRNLRHDCRTLHVFILELFIDLEFREQYSEFQGKMIYRPDDLRREFEQFGHLKDVYLPRDYYSGEPRGFGFVQFVDPADADEAKYQMDGQILLGRQLTVVFAEENRKKPTDMRARERRSMVFVGHGGTWVAFLIEDAPLLVTLDLHLRAMPDQGLTAVKTLLLPREGITRGIRLQISFSIASLLSVSARERSYSRSPVRERSPPYNGRSRSPVRELSPPSRGRNRSPVRELSPVRDRSRSLSPIRSRSRSRRLDRDNSPSQ